MRIAHVVAYVSDDGAYGGPARVAEAQARALPARGHEVSLFAGSPLKAPAVTTVAGYRLHRFPSTFVHRRLGFAGIVTPGLSSASRWFAASFDVVHVHLARDLTTLPIAARLRRAGVPYVVQTHGMIDSSTRLLAKPLDAIMTRSALRGASRVLTLTEREDQEIREVEPRAALTRVKNGLAVAPTPTYDNRNPTVLFLARLHPRKRALAFVEMARLVGSRHPEISFLLAGKDEGDGPIVRAAIDAAAMGERLTWIGPVNPNSTDQLLESARAFVLPSYGEVFPMSLLESFRAGTPSIVTESLEIAATCYKYGAAEVTDGTPEHLADSVTRILEDPKLAERLRRGAAAYLREELDIDHVARELEGVYMTTLT